MNKPSLEPIPLPSPPCATAAQDPARWFAEEVHPHGTHLKAWLRGAFPTVRSDVDDVVQESYLRLWRRHAKNPIESAKSFLYRAARHIAIDLLRRQKRSRVDTVSSLDGLHILDEAPNAVRALTTKEKYALLAEAIASLPQRRYEVVLLHKFRGLPQKEVAAKLGISPRTVEVHVRLAVKYCEEFLYARGVDRLDE